MNDSLRESLSYFGLYRKMFRIRKKYIPEKVSYGGFLWQGPGTVFPVL